MPRCRLLNILEFAGRASDRACHHGACCTGLNRVSSALPWHSKMNCMTAAGQRGFVQCLG